MDKIKNKMKGTDKLFSIIYPNPNNQTIILLHGGPIVLSDFHEVIDILKDYFQIITFLSKRNKKSPCLKRLFH